MTRSAVRLFLSAGLLIYLIAATLPALALSANSNPARWPLPATISEDDYWTLVEQTRQVIAGLKGLPAQKIEQELSLLAAEWNSVDAIRLDGDQIVPIDNSHLLSLLNAENPDLDRILGLLKVLQAAHDSYPTQVFTTDDLASLESILLRPEFQWQAQQGPNPIAEWFARLWERINEWLNDLFGDGVSLPAIPGSWSIPTILTSILLILILLYIARNLIMDFVGDARLDGDGNSADEKLTSDLAFKKAMDLSRGGDYRSAVRFLYLSSLLLLDEGGLLQYDRSKTNREYLHSVSGSPQLAEPLEEVIEVFDDVWYGHHALDEDSFKHYSERVEQLREQSK
jgi:hypothetical protein